MINRKNITFKLEDKEFILPELTLELELDLDFFFKDVMKLVGETDGEVTGESMQVAIGNADKKLVVEIGKWGIDNIKGLENESLLSSYMYMFYFIIDFVTKRLEFKKK